MTDTPTESNSQVSTDNSSRSDAETETLVAFAGCDIVNINSNTMALAINSKSGAQSVIAPDVVTALGVCTKFDTIEAHSQRICTAFPGLAAQRATVVETLKQLRIQEILLSSDKLHFSLKQGEASPRGALRLCIMTADRPDILSRLLESLLKSSGLSDFQQLFLIDDSRDPEKARANRDAVESFNLRCARSMVYVGESLQQRIVDHLCETLPESRNAIEFLLQREYWNEAKTYGRSRTLGLLLTAGCRALFLDDDIVCDALTPVGSSMDLRLGSSSTREARFYPFQAEMFTHARRLQDSPLKLHADFLGSTLGALSSSHGEIDLRFSEAAVAMQLSGDSSVLVTQCGSWGDPGTGDPHWVMNLAADSIAPLVDSDTDLRTLIEGRHCWFGNKRPTLLKHAFMSQMTGLDNRSLLPPYFPAFRGEDQLFGSMVNVLHPHSVAVDLPWGVPHLPDDGRGIDSMRHPVATAGGMGLAARLVDSFVDYDSRESAEERLTFVAAQLQRVSKRSVDDIEVMYRAIIARARAEQYQRIQTLRAATADFPSKTWLGYLDRGLEELHGTLSKPDTLPTLTPGSGLTREAIGERLLDAVRGYGDALAQWPAMRDESSALLGLIGPNDTP